MNPSSFARSITMLFVCVATTLLYGQTGSISGKVTETFAGSTEAVIGAIVNIEGSSKAAATDTAGFFKIDNLAKGIYNLKITYVGYSPKTVKGVEVRESQNTHLPRIGIEEDVKTTQEVEVIGTRQTGSDVSVLKEIKTLDVVASGISSEQIKRTLDRDAADVAKRVSGVTVVDNRFVIVRGLSERYNAVMLNDALAPSYEQDVKSFSLDNVNSSYIDRIIIYKSPSPDLPGDFAGGVVKIYTHGMPVKNNFSVGLSSSYRQGTTFQDFKSLPQGKYGWLGYDDGSYAFPKGVPPDYNTSTGGAKYDAIKVGNLFPSNTWYPTQKTATPDMRFNVNGGYRLPIGGGKLLGISFGINYSTIYSKWYDAKQALFNLTNDDLEMGILLRNNLDTYTRSTRVGGLLNMTLQLNSNHSISFRNLYSHTGNARYRNAYFQKYASYDAYKTNPSAYTIENDVNLSNSFGGILGSQLTGKHNLSTTSEMNWLIGYARAERNEPDVKNYTYQLLEPSKEYRYIFGSFPSPLNVGRLYFKTLEEVKTVSADLSKKTISDLLGQTEITFKGGLYIENKQRMFNQKSYGYGPNIQEPQPSPDFYNDADFSHTPPSELNNAASWNNYNGLVIVPFLTDGSYNAIQDLYGLFGMAKINWREKLNLTGGVRMEGYNRVILGSKMFVQNWLPSLNASYNISKKWLLRGSYGKTVNRPDIREAARISSFDFYLQCYIRGNEKLRPSTIDNFDLRLEFYPQPDEGISFGVFYKQFKDPIERILYDATSQINNFSNYEYNFLNAKTAYSRGIELEIRKSLRDIISIGGKDILKDVSITANGSLLESKIIYDKESLQNSGLVKFDPEATAENGQPYTLDLVNQFLEINKDRSMFGQSPYVVNAGITYNSDKLNSMVNVSYNIMGTRLYSVIPNLGSVYEVPKHSLDITFIHNFGKYIELKMGIQDIINQKVQFVQDVNSDGKVKRIKETGYPTDFNDPKSIYYDDAQFFKNNPNPDPNATSVTNQQGDIEFLGFRRGSYYSIGLTFKF